MSLLSEKKIPAEIKVIYTEFIETWKRKINQHSQMWDRDISTTRGVC